MRRRGEIATNFFVNHIGLFPSPKEVLEELRQMNLRLAPSSVSASARPFLHRQGGAPAYTIGRKRPTTS